MYLSLEVYISVNSLVADLCSLISNHFKLNPTCVIWSLQSDLPLSQYNRYSWTQQNIRYYMHV